MGDFLKNYKKTLEELRRDYPKYEVWSDNYFFTFYGKILEEQIINEFITKTININKTIEELKNRFIKKMVDSEYYEAMTDEQKHSIGKKASFFEDLFPTGILSDPDDRPEVVTQVIEDLEEEQEEENGFN
jgi:hypothetical protein